MHYVPLFSSIVTSSLWCEPDHVLKIFLTMLAVKDRHNEVKLSAFALSQLAHKTEQEVLDALKVLSSPDTKRLEPQEYDGRRIERTEDGGWLILNGKYYQDLMVKSNRNAYQCKKQAEYRAKRKGASSRETIAVSQFENGKVDQNFQPINDGFADLQA